MIPSWAKVPIPHRDAVQILTRLPVIVKTLARRLIETIKRDPQTETAESLAILAAIRVRLRETAAAVDAGTKPPRERDQP